MLLIHRNTLTLPPKEPDLVERLRREVETLKFAASFDCVLAAARIPPASGAIHAGPPPLVAATSGRRHF